MPSEIDPEALARHTAEQERLRDPRMTEELIRESELLAARLQELGALEQAQHALDEIADLQEMFPAPRNSTQVQLMNLALQSHLQQYRTLLPKSSC